MKMHGSACVLQTMAIDKYTLLNVFSYRGRSVSFNSLTKNQVKEARIPTLLSPTKPTSSRLVGLGIPFPMRNLHYKPS
jgi:hypothetical protein